MATKRRNLRLFDTLPLPTRTRPWVFEAPEIAWESLKADLPCFADIRRSYTYGAYMERSVLALAEAFSKDAPNALSVADATSLYVHLHDVCDASRVRKRDYGDPAARLAIHEIYVSKLLNFTAWLVSRHGALLAVQAADQALTISGPDSGYVICWDNPVAVSLRQVLSQVPEAEYEATLAWCLAEHAANPNARRAANFTFLLADDRPGSHPLQPQAQLAATYLHASSRAEHLRTLSLVPLLMEAVPSVLPDWRALPAYFEFSQSYVSPAQAAATALAAAKTMGRSAYPALTLLLRHSRNTGCETERVASALLETREPGALAHLLPWIEKKAIRDAVYRAVEVYPKEMFQQCLGVLSSGHVTPTVQTCLLKLISRHGPAMVREWAATLDARAIDHLKGLLGASWADMAPPDAWPEVLRAPPWRQERREPVAPVVLTLPSLSAPATYSEEAAHLLRWGRGDGVVPKLLRLLDTNPFDGFWYAQEVDAADIAWHAARALLRPTRARALAIRWLRRYPRTALMRLVPEAVGRPGEARDAAENALRWFRQNLGDDGSHLAAVVAEYSAAEPRVANAVAEILNRDPLQLAPASAPKLPAWFSPAALSRPVLRSGGALPDEALKAVAEMLAFSKPGETYAGLAVLREACTPDSLAAFAWELLSVWLAAGAPSKSNWAIYAVAWLGDDGCTRKLAELIRQWPTEFKLRLALLGIDVLAEMAGDAAVLELRSLADKGRFKKLREAARAKLSLVAKLRSLTMEEPIDVVVPDLGLDERGGLDLDFGPRQFRVGFDEFLKPWVRDAAGIRLKELPKPNQTDDAERSAAAASRWRAMKLAAREVARQQIPRLRSMLLASRRLSPAAFRRFFVSHRLMRNLAQRLVWGIYDDNSPLSRPRVTFRIAEDLGLVDAEDKPVALDASQDAAELVGLLHPLQARDDELEVWGNIFGDYEILPPFPQLSRAPFTLTEAEKGETTLERFKGRQVPIMHLYAMSAFGWSLSRSQESGTVNSAERAFICPDGRRGVAILELGYVPYGEVPHEEEVRTLGILRIGPDRTTDRRSHILWGDLDVATASEILRAVTLIAGAGTP